MTQESTVEPGIRGWLILVAVLLIGGPGNLMAHARSFQRVLDSPVVRTFCDPASPTYDARWPVFVFVETSGFAITAFVIFLLLWPLFFLKHRLFRGTCVAVALSFASLLVVRAGLVATIGTVAAGFRANVYAQTAIWLPFLLVLSVYMLRSRRAQTTFRHRVAPYPVFPFFIRL